MYASRTNPDRPVNLLTDLRPRQQQVLRLIAEGFNTKTIALDLKLSEKTVEWHRAQLMARTRIYSIALLTRLAIRFGLVWEPAAESQLPKPIQRRD